MVDMLLSVDPDMASFFGPGQRYRVFAILDVVALRQRLQKRCGIAQN